ISPPAPRSWRATPKSSNRFASRRRRNSRSRPRVAIGPTSDIEFVKRNPGLAIRDRPRNEQEAGSMCKRMRVPCTAATGILAVVLLISCLESAAIAQTQSATLVGSVRDSTGAVVPGAKVTVVNTETSFLSETTTSADGAYYVPYLSPGPYRITLEANGFKRAVHDGVMVRSAETPRVDVTLEVGSVNEAVEVSAQSPL